MDTSLLLLEGAALLQVILIDVVLSGDNAVVIGTLAASLPEHQRNKAIALGMTMAVAMRILLSLVAVYLLHIPGLMVFGGALLLYVAYGMWKDLRDDGELNDSTGTKTARTFAGALVAIGLADLSMSLDNIIGVAGAAAEHPISLIIGLVLSIAMMGFAAKIVSNLIEKHRWIAWVGLALILFIAGKMFYEGIPTLVHFIH